MKKILWLCSALPPDLARRVFTGSLTRSLLSGAGGELGVCGLRDQPEPDVQRGAQGDQSVGLGGAGNSGGRECVVGGGNRGDDGR